MTERAERFANGLLCGRQWIVAVAVPAAFGDVRAAITAASSEAHELAEESIGNIAASLILRRRHVRDGAEPATFLRGDDGRQGSLALGWDDRGAGDYSGLGLLPWRAFRAVH